MQSTFIVYNIDSLVTCEALVPIPYGHISYQIVDTIIVQPGDVATYSCDTLYTLQGTQHRICLRNGTWNGAEPICLGICINTCMQCAMHYGCAMMYLSLCSNYLIAIMLYEIFINFYTLAIIIIAGLLSLIKMEILYSDCSTSY